MKSQITKAAFFVTILFLAGCVNNKTNQSNVADGVFEVKNPDYEKSPFTGMVRQHWVDAAHYLLEGAFYYVEDINSPMKFPKQPGKSYPHDERRVPTEKLEGLCRTLFVAAPLLKENPDLVMNNIKVADYYQHQIVLLTDSTSPSYIVPRPKNGGPSQNLVEFGALAISLFVAPEVIWEPLSQAEKDALAHVVLSYGDGPTVPSNWKFFNIFVLSFFKSQGYKVNEPLLVEYLEKSLDHYRGDGWYNDAPAYDYYSMWAFQLYGAVWAEVFGNEYYPELTSKFVANYKDMFKQYPYMFSKDGKMNMYGRSISYRFASVSPFPFAGKYAAEEVNLGWLRKISSSTLLQFMQHPKFLKDSVPTLGFYGPFEPAVQVYSCRGSVFWMGKAFLGLLMPKEDPFWTAVENDGPWDNELEKEKVYNHFATGSEILLTNYPNIGASEIRAWCHEKVKDDWQKFRSTENYNRLSYNTAFPWQADGSIGEIAMNYGFMNSQSEWEVFRLYSFKKFEEGTYYRDAVLETDESIKMNLAEVLLVNGILRVDRNISPKDIDMRLGHYALPEFGSQIKESSKKVGKYNATIIDNGVYQLAMVPLLGWENTKVVRTEGMHPESKKSAIINVAAKYKSQSMPQIYATLMLWKKSGEKWTDEDLLPVKDIKIDNEKTSINIEFNDNEKILNINY